MAKASTKILRQSLLLERHMERKEYTGGTLWVCERGKRIDKLCDTLELPWRDNKVCVSRIPTGTYQLLRRTTGRYATIARKRWGHGWVWEIKDVPGRTAILIHWGNYPKHTQGCVLLGEMDYEKGMLRNSQRTYANFFAGYEENPEADKYDPHPLPVIDKITITHA